MKVLLVGLFLLIHMLGFIHGTCVLESDFGFIINCNFKKSSLFRVRNLGGVKAHFGLGFSLGDELGLAESLGNLEGNKRRSVSNFDAQLAAANNNVGVLPAEKLTAKEEKRSASQPFAFAFKQPDETTTRAPIFYKRNTPIAMTEAKSLPLGVPAFKPLKAGVPLPPSLESNIQSMVHKKQMEATQNAFNRKAALYQFPAPNLSAANISFIQSQLAQQNYATKRKEPMVISPQANAFKVPAFQALPSSVSRISTGQIVHANSNLAKLANNPFLAISRVDNFNSKSDPNEAKPLPEVDLKGHTVEELAAVANVSVAAIKKAIEMRQKQLLAEQEQQMRKQVLEQEAKREEQIAQQLAIYQQEHQKFLATSTTGSPTTTVKATTTSKPITRAPAPATRAPNKLPANGLSKVMNAPKEYYPVGYDKNFDDNFTTKVDLPPTSFHCGDQKHFPGLYGDVDLGCMVFHVCALTDDGLIMKSFLCPESTLFDQTILKCNWWFYVDCKSSKTLYDSNLPVSKSYQLMKALTFFSNYKKKSSGESGDGGSSSDDDGVDIEALKNSVISKRNTDKTIE